FGQLYDGLFDFFFQAEDGIRDRNVTGVQTCALPIFRAEELGIPAFCGMEMLVAQAVFASARFLDRKVDLSHVEKINRDIRRQVSNVSLIGMPGSGKSTVGRALSRALGKTYVDLDDVIEQVVKMPIPDIFAQRGEKVFRKYEAAAVRECAKQHGQVIACWGGVIKTPGNARL